MSIYKVYRNVAVCIIGKIDKLITVRILKHKINIRNTLHKASIKENINNNIYNFNIEIMKNSRTTKRNSVEYY